MGERIGDELVEIEATVEHTTAKAWLINELMSGKQVWLPKSVGTVIKERDEEGHLIFQVQEWWAKKNGVV